MWYRVDIATKTKLRVKNGKKFKVRIAKVWKTYLLTQSKSLAEYVYYNLIDKGYLFVRVKKYKKKPRWLR